MSQLLTRVSVGIGVALAASALALSLPTPAQGHKDPDGKVGVLIMDHGEPPKYDRHTYGSFRKFFDHLMEMGAVPSELKAIDGGTILQDRNCPMRQCGNPSLIDAWLDPHEGPAAFVPGSDDLPSHYLMPGGPGLSEPDIFEHVGLVVWDEWERMGGRSPNYDEKLPKKQAVIERLKQTYGDRIAVEVGYGIDPDGPNHGSDKGIKEAVDSLIDQHVRGIVAPYHGVGFSDIMQTHMLQHEVHAALEDRGVHGHDDGFVRFETPMGRTDAYVAAVVEKVRDELRALPEGASKVALHLSGHGLSTKDCWKYKCGEDAYHRYSADLFARTKAAIEKAVDRPGLGVFHVYGEGGDDESDPEDKVESPIEALAKRKQEGFTHVVDVPYEFDSNSRDTLIVLRKGYGIDPKPAAWNERWESHFERDGVSVKLANSLGGDALKIAALEELARDGLRHFFPPPPRPGRCANERRGTNGHDTLTGTGAGDRLFGLAGNDLLEGLAGEDCLYGGPGFDRLDGGEGRDGLLGGDESDLLVGRGGNDVMFGQGSDDRGGGGAGDDFLGGGSGSDALSGGSGSDNLHGGSGNDSLSGGGGHDKLSGASGQNRYSAAEGDDSIGARNGVSETVSCGPGRDEVVVDRKDRVRGCEMVRRR